MSYWTSLGLISSILWRHSKEPRFKMILMTRWCIWSWSLNGAEGSGAELSHNKLSRTRLILLPPCSCATSRDGCYAADVTGWVKFIGFILNASANSVRHNSAVVIKTETLTHEPGLCLKSFYDRIIWLNHLRFNFFAHTWCTCWTLWNVLRAMWMMLRKQPAVIAYDAGWGACVKKAVLLAS